MTKENLEYAVNLQKAINEFQVMKEIIEEEKLVRGQEHGRKMRIILEEIDLYSDKTTKRACLETKYFLDDDFEALCSIIEKAHSIAEDYLKKM